METQTNSGNSGRSAHAHPKMESTTHHLGTIAHEAVDTVREAMRGGKASVVDQYDVATKWAGNMARNKPLRTFGVVAAAGLVIGLLLGRR